MELLEVYGENKFNIEKNCLIKYSENEYLKNLKSEKNLENVGVDSIN